MRANPALFLPLQLFALLFLSFSVAVAQTTEQCRALFANALSTAALQCDGLASDTACYGAVDVTATFAEPAPPDPFENPGDQVAIEQLESLSTSPVNVVDGTVGIAFMRVQANLPAVQPEQSVLFVIVGGQEVESGVEPQSALDPFQSFYLPTPSFDGDCAGDVPPMVFIQSPEDVAANLVIYGIPAQIQGTMTVRVTPDTDPLGARLEFAVLDGELVLNPGAPNEIIVPAGSAISVPLADQIVSLGIEGDLDERQLGDTFSQIRTLTPGELEFMNGFGDLPLTVLNYDFLADDAEPTPTPSGPTPPQPPSPPGGGVIGGGPVPVTPNCANFAITSPLNGLAYGVNTVYWNPAQSVSGYTVTASNIDNGQSTSVSVGPLATNAQIDTSSLGQGITFQLRVAAMSNGVDVCQIARTMFREWPPDDDDDETCPPGQQPSGVGGACIPAP